MIEFFMRVIDLTPLILLQRLIRMRARAGDEGQKRTMNDDDDDDSSESTTEVSQVAFDWQLAAK
jgi:hypothetical protein